MLKKKTTMAYINSKKPDFPTAMYLNNIEMQKTDESNIIFTEPTIIDGGQRGWVGSSKWTSKETKKEEL